MKKLSLVLLGCFFLIAGNSFASEQMRINIPGTGCDHNPFAPGQYSTAVLDATDGAGGDGIELLGKNANGVWEAKRLLTDKSGWTRVYQYVGGKKDGQCVRIFRERPISMGEIKKNLLKGNESLTQTTVSELDQSYYGSVLTEGVYIVYK